MKALSYEEFDRFKHEKITIENSDINKTKKIIDTFIKEFEEKFDFHFKKYNFKLIFNNSQYVANIKTSPHNIRITMSSGYLLKEAFNDINNQGCTFTFDRIDELNIIAIADKIDLTNDF